MLVHQRVNHPHFCSMSATNSHLTDDTRTTPAAFLTFALPWKVTWCGSSSRKMSHKTKHNGDIIGIYSNSKSCKLVPGLFPKLRKKQLVQWSKCWDYYLWIYGWMGLETTDWRALHCALAESNKATNNANFEREHPLSTPHGIFYGRCN